MSSASDWPAPAWERLGCPWEGGQRDEIVLIERQLLQLVKSRQRKQPRVNSLHGSESDPFQLQPKITNTRLVTNSSQHEIESEVARGKRSLKDAVYDCQLLQRIKESSEILSPRSTTLVSDSFLHKTESGASIASLQDPAFESQLLPRTKESSEVLSPQSATLVSDSSHHEIEGEVSKASLKVPTFESQLLRRIKESFEVFRPQFIESEGEVSRASL